MSSFSMKCEFSLQYDKIPIVLDFSNSFLFSACWISLFFYSSKAISWFLKILFSDIKLSRFAEYSAEFCWLMITKCWFSLYFSFSSSLVKSNSPITFRSSSPKFLLTNYVSSAVVDKHFLFRSLSSYFLVFSIRAILLLRLPICSLRAEFYLPYSYLSKRISLSWPYSCFSLMSTSAAVLDCSDLRLYSNWSFSCFNLAF